MHTHKQTEERVFVLSSQQTHVDEDPNTPSFGHSSPTSPFLSSSIHASLSRLTSSTNLVFHVFSHLNSSPLLPLSPKKNTPTRVLKDDILLNKRGELYFQNDFWKIMWHCRLVLKIHLVRREIFYWFFTYCILIK